VNFVGARRRTALDRFAAAAAAAGGGAATAAR
jgi:hypothetical protein